MRYMQVAPTQSVCPLAKVAMKQSQILRYWQEKENSVLTESRKPDPISLQYQNFNRLAQHAITFFPAHSHRLGNFS